MGAAAHGNEGPQSPRCTAVLLAGGGADDPVAAAAGATAKGLVDVGGATLVARAAGALAAAPAIERVICVGRADVTDAARDAVVAAAGIDAGRSRGGDTTSTGVEFASVPSGRDFAGSLALGLGAAAAAGAARIVVATADLPWIDADAVQRFVREANAVTAADRDGASADVGAPRERRRTPADVVYPIVPRRASEARFPEQARTWVRLHGAGGTPDDPDAAIDVTGGNLAFLRPAAVPGVVDLAAVAYRARKNPLSLARIVGLEALLRLAIGRLRLERLEDRIGRMVGAPVRALVTDDARLSADLDRPEPAPDRPTPGPAQERRSR